MDILNDEISDLEENFDIVVCVNTLEHLEDDLLAVERMKKMLEPNGNLIIVVPALQKLYCYMDKNVGHYRRYKKGQLNVLAQKNGMEIVYNRYFNLPGVFPYYIKGKFGKNRGGSFSSDIDENKGKLISMASVIVESIEKLIPPLFGISEIMVLRKR